METRPVVWRKITRNLDISRSHENARENPVRPDTPYAFSCSAPYLKKTPSPFSHAWGDHWFRVVGEKDQNVPPKIKRMRSDFSPHDQPWEKTRDRKDSRQESPDEEPSSRPFPHHGEYVGIDDGIVHVCFRPEKATAAMMMETGKISINQDRTGFFLFQGEAG